MVEFLGLIICVPLYAAVVLFLGATISAGIFVFHVAVVPLIFKYSKAFRRNLVFANFVQWPLNTDFDKPSSSGIDGARNFSIEYDSKVDKCKVKIGMWHIVPKTVYERLKGSFETTTDKEELDIILDEELTKSKTPIILYCHGNSNSRAASHRIQLYKFFQKMEFHTITFDYRGYGDSTYLRPSEAGVVEDALVVYDWLHTMLSNNSNIFVWGHSLGTAISSHLLGNLQELSVSLLDRLTPLPLPNGLILEAPFNNLADEVAKHPLSKLVTWLPYYESTFVAPFRMNDEQTFKSDEYLIKAKALPVLILHAKDDVIVPFIVGLRLYRAILQSRGKEDATVKLHAYDTKQNLGHKGICNARDLPEVIGTVFLAGASLTASLLVVQVAVLPLVFKYSKSVQRKMVFSNCSAWHIIPCSMFREVFVIRDYVTVDARLHQELKRTKNTVVLYCHGNSNHRASPHRLQMYKVFQELNFHVITIDYRGYGDSTRVRPTERGVVEDALAIYAWLINALNENNRPPVVIWGHSLGTAVAANMAAHLTDLCNEQGRPQLPFPDALVLEAPFNNLMDEIESHPFAKLVSWLPYYRDMFVKPFTVSSEYAFTTDQYLANVPKLPILMLHSKGDKIVPYSLAVKLHEKVAASRTASDAPLVFHAFERGTGLGHNNLCEAPELGTVVGDFLQLVQQIRQENAAPLGTRSIHV